MRLSWIGRQQVPADAQTRTWELWQLGECRHRSRAGPLYGSPTIPRKQPCVFHRNVRLVLTACYCLLSFDFSSIKRLVRRTRPRSCVHSDTMFPTTCPHFPSESIFM